MKNEIKIGSEVVMTKGDSIGKTGIVIEIENNRAKVEWVHCLTTKVSIESLALTSIPFEIIPFKEWKDHKGQYRNSKPKYVRL